MAKKSDRIIIDTNLWISFLITKDFKKLDERIKKRKLKILFSLESIEEFLMVAQTIPKQKTGAFMRDVLTKQETPLHRAAAFGDIDSIQLLLKAGADKTKKDMYGDSPLSWASWHLRPARILSLLTYGEHSIHPLHIEKNVSDHGNGWGNGMEANLLGKIHVEK